MTELTDDQTKLVLSDGTRQIVTSWTRCGRPTKAKTPCRNYRMASQDREWPSCSRHATEQEAAEHQAALLSARQEADRLLREHHQALLVACWSWPVTDEHLQRAADVRACPDPEQVYRLAWELLAGWQDHRCAICGSSDDRYLDHSHKTELVRGWLCRRCNIGEGFKDVPGGRFERYREKHPTSILGIEMRYRNPWPSWYESRPVEHDRSPGYLLASYLADGGDDG